MSPSSWKQGWRLWSPRSYAEALDTRSGDRLVLQLRDRNTGVTLDRFGPNVGQPSADPPFHREHHDLPELASGLRPGCWTQDGCYQLELERPEVHARITLADSRSLACGPSNDPVLRQGVLLCHVECLRLSDSAELSFEARGGPLNKLALQGAARIQGDRIGIVPGTSAFVVHHTPTAPEPAKAAKRIRQMRSYVRHFGRAQLSGPQRMGHAVRWNICWDQQRQAIYMAVNRAWVEMMARVTGLPAASHGPLIFGWDTALSSILVSRSEPTLAREMVRSVLARQQPDGRLPTVAVGEHDGDRCAPPLLPLAVWYLCHDGDWDFAAEVLPALERAHRWVMERRQPRGDGLLCWGDDAHKQGPLRVDGWAGAAYESGLDNSPMWEEVGYDASTRSLGQASVDLCSMAALSARVLAVLAKRTGSDPAPFVRDYRRIRHAVNSRLWGADQQYHNLTVTGEHGAVVSPTSFYPMLAGLSSRDQARAMITRHLRNSAGFWGHPVIPSVPRDSPHYDGDGDYWRGRIWPPMNFLVWAGLRQYNPGEAAHLAEHSRLLFDEEWERHGHVHENYSAETAAGEPRPGTFARSCPLYCWGGLLLLPEAESKTVGAMARLPRIPLD